MLFKTGVADRAPQTDFSPAAPMPIVSRSRKIQSPMVIFTK